MPKVNMCLIISKDGWSEHFYHDDKSWEYHLLIVMNKWNALCSISHSKLKNISKLTLEEFIYLYVNELVNRLRGYYSVINGLTEVKSSWEVEK